MSCLVCASLTVWLRELNDISATLTLKIMLNVHAVQLSVFTFVITISHLSELYT